MAKNKTDKSRWYSKRAEGYISDSQYLAEFICERLAAAKKLPLVGKFWNVPTWEKTYKQQLRLAVQLLKLYKVESILAALKSRDGRSCWSLAATWLDPLITREEGKIERLQEKAQREELIEDQDSLEFSDCPLFAPAYLLKASGVQEKPKKNNNLLRDLRELDG